ncbi:MAG: protein phosphatase 2C domain-containing protein [Planctomycetota bacterium]
MSTPDQQHEFCIDSDMQQPSQSQLLRGAVVVSTRCPEKPTANEDTAAIIAHSGGGLLLVVADGMGGASAGDRAAKITVETLSEAVAKLPPDNNLRSAVLDGIEEANRRVLDLKLGAGCTLAVVELQENVARPYHVGDTAIAIFGQRGKLKLATASHSPVGMAVEAGMLNDEEAMHHEDRHLVTNAVGLQEMRIEIGPPIRLSPLDTLVIASDGLFDNLHLCEIVDTLRTGRLLDSVGQMATLAMQRMVDPHPGEPSKPDDLTAIAYRPSAQ